MIGRAGLGDDPHRTVVIAMVAMGVVQVAADQVVGVIAVRHRLMATDGTVNMVGRVPIAGVIGRASVGIGGIGRQTMLIGVVAVGVVQVAIVEIVHMVGVGDGGVATTGTMGVLVVRVGAAGLCGHALRVAPRGSWSTHPRLRHTLTGRLCSLGTARACLEARCCGCRSPNPADGPPLRPPDRVRRRERA